MSDAVSALRGESSSEGIVSITETGPQGMITLRADLASKEVANALKQTGFTVPAQRGVTTKGALSAFWMSPDELLLTCPYDDVAGLVSTLGSALANTHALVVNVSDARALFRVTGPHTREVIAKLAPVDLSPAAFPVGSFRRTRMGQVAAAFHMKDAETCEVICFRSVARYMFDVLKKVSAKGSEVGFF